MAFWSARTLLECLTWLISYFNVEIFFSSSQASLALGSKVASSHSASLSWFFSELISASLAAAIDDERHRSVESSFDVSLSLLFRWQLSTLVLFNWASSSLNSRLYLVDSSQISAFLRDNVRRRARSLLTAAAVVAATAAAAAEAWARLVHGT